MPRFRRRCLMFVFEAVGVYLSAVVVTVISPCHRFLVEIVFSDSICELATLHFAFEEDSHPMSGFHLLPLSPVVLLSILLI